MKKRQRDVIPTWIKNALLSKVSLRRAKRRGNPSEPRPASLANTGEDGLLHYARHDVDVRTYSFSDYFGIRVSGRN